MAVRRFDHLRWMVDSHRGSESYLVDLGDPLFPSGRCSCPHYQNRIQPYVERGEKLFRRHCKHIVQVIESETNERTK